MLIIVSDIHLGDGTCGKSISASAFHLFADRLRELAFNASWRSDGTYHPIKEINILMLGDIFDALHSTRWLNKGIGEPGYFRPWTDFQAPEFAAALKDITKNILNCNAEAVGILKGLTRNSGLNLPPATRAGIPDKRTRQGAPVNVHIHYMVGNHDWYYHLPGPAFDSIREEIVQACGLSNPPGPFPHELHESTALHDLLDRFKVYAQHGDLFDSFNFSPKKGRNAATLGDAFVVEVINRFPLEVKKRLQEDLPPILMESLYDLVNVRPALATPLWIGSLLRQNKVSPAVQQKLKELWDEVCNEFLALPFVQEEDKPFKLDVVDGLELAVQLTNRFSFKTIDDIVIWVRKKFNPTGKTFAHHALKEEAFLNREAHYVVYGHTHHYEIVPLDSFPGTPRPTHQLYINSGTWHTYFDLATNKPREQKFIPYQVLTYLTFYSDDERGGNRFETWTGTFSD
jgi:UDP-2,3-diacylglucosamine pyrophosphatase LpxH